MDRMIFMTVEDFVELNNELLKNTGFSLYVWDDFAQQFSRLDKVGVEVLKKTDPSFNAWFVGDKKEEARMLVYKNPVLKREERKGLVTLRYGGDDEYAIGMSRYSADGSEVEKKVNRELGKLLRKYAKKGVLESDGSASKVTDNYFWTEKAFDSGKNWRLFLGRGVREESNKRPGFIPKL